MSEPDLQSKKDPKDFLLVAMFIAWGVMRLWRSSQESFSVVGFAPAALHFFVAWLFFKRAGLKEAASIMGLVSALPSFVAGGVMMKHCAPAAPDWPIYAEGLFAFAALGTIASLLSLGKSFAILPGRREIKTHGFYRFVRHPVYLFELIMLAAILLSNPTTLSYGLFAMALFWLVVRIGVEEKLLRRDPDYVNYQKRVRARLIPFVF